MGNADAKAREELAWYFSGLGPAVGLRAASIDGGGGGGIYDEAASIRDHMRHFEPSHRAQVRRMHAVQATLRRIDRTDAGMLSLAFTPFGAARASWRLLTALSADGICLVAPSLQTRSLPALWRQTVGDGDQPPPFVLLMFLEDQVRHLKRGNRIPASHGLQRVLDEARDSVTASLRSYAAARSEVARAVADEESERRSRNMAELRARLDGDDASSFGR